MSKCKKCSCHCGRPPIKHWWEWVTHKFWNGWFWVIVVTRVWKKKK